MTDDAFRRLVSMPKAGPQAGTTPWPPLAQLYHHLDGPSDEERLEIACAAIRSIGLIGKWFEESCMLCADWDNTKDAFHPAHVFTEAHKRDQGNLRRTVHFAAMVEEPPPGADRWTVEGAPELSFRYVEREVPPARTKQTSQFESGALSTKGLKLDLLLADPELRPIFTEVKLRRDKDPFVALVQVLTLTSQLVSIHQRSRLAAHYDGRLKSDGRPSAMVIVLPPAESAEGARAGRDWRKLYARAVDLVRPLMSCTPVGDRLAHLGIVEAHVTEDEQLTFRAMAVASAR